MPSSTHTPSIVYPYLYAVHVIEEFEQKYSRVINFTAKMLGMDPKDFRDNLVKCFMYRNGRWNSLRETLKYVDKHDLYDHIAGFELEDRKLYLNYVKYFVQDKLIDDKNLLKRD